MKKTNKAFSLIEIIVAASILSIAVFWVYKLIAENTKIINNNDNYTAMYNLFPSFEECVSHIWFDSFKSSSDLDYSFNFWANWIWCFTWTSNTITINNIDYELFWTITNSGSNFINWNLEILAEGVWKIIKDYKQIN